MARNVLRNGNTAPWLAFSFGMWVTAIALAAGVLRPALGREGANVERRPLTAAECHMVPSWLSATEENLRAALRQVEQHGARPTDVDVDVAIVRKWLQEEMDRARAWAAEGCPDDGVRGAYVVPGTGTVSYRLFEREVSPPSPSAPPGAPALQVGFR
mgnify:CR=1 FL=1